MVISMVSFRRRLRVFVVIFSALGSYYGQAESVPPGKARIVIFRQGSLGGSIGRGWPVKVDGQEIGSVKAGGSAIAAVAPGPHTLSLEMFDFPGVSREMVNVGAGHSYYYEVRLKAKAKKALQSATSFGIIGWAVGSSAAINAEPNGLFEFVAAPTDAISGEMAPLPDKGNPVNKPGIKSPSIPNSPKVISSELPRDANAPENREIALKECREEAKANMIGRSNISPPTWISNCVKRKTGH